MKKSHIKPKSFYKEAEDMQKGWGGYLKKIDKLKDKKQNNSLFTLSEFCWTLYGYGHCSSSWHKFEQFAKKSGKSKLRYNDWNNLFKKWNKL